MLGKLFVAGPRSASPPPPITALSCLIAPVLQVVPRRPGGDTPHLVPTSPPPSHTTHVLWSGGNGCEARMFRISAGDGGCGCACCAIPPPRQQLHLSRICKLGPARLGHGFITMGPQTGQSSSAKLGAKPVVPSGQLPGQQKWQFGRSENFRISDQR